MKIEELSGALARLLGMVNNQENEDIIQEARQVLDSYFKKDLMGMDMEDWQNWLQHSEHDTQELVLLADILELASSQKKLDDTQSETSQKYEKLKRFIIEQRNTFPFHWAGK